MAPNRASADTAALLADGEVDAPPGVQRVAAFLSGHGVWFTLSRNPSARSCRDAAHKRLRLGHVGIPLWDELKSFFGRLPRPSGPPEYVVVHCRADRQLDFDQVAAALGEVEPPERLPADELEQLGMAYGLVHPFVPWALDGQLLASSVRQVFDRDLLRPIGVPGTMMTNAGDLTWAIEVHMEDLVATIEPKVVADVSVPDEHEPPRPLWTERQPVIGIITGNSPESGMALWSHVNRIVRDRLGVLNLGDVSMPRVLVHSLPEMGLSMELSSRSEPVWAAIEQAVQQMTGAGAQTIALACNTTQFFADRIQALAQAQGAEFVSMPEAVAAHLRSEGISEIALVGIESVSDLGEWSAYRAPFADFEVEVPTANTMHRIDQLAYKVKREGPTDAALNHLRDILKREVKCTHVVIALTELSLLAEKRRRRAQDVQVLVDTLAVYADAIVDRTLGVANTIPGE